MRILCLEPHLSHFSTRRRILAIALRVPCEKGWKSLVYRDPRARFINKEIIWTLKNVTSVARSKLDINLKRRSL